MRAAPGQITLQTPLFGYQKASRVLIQFGITLIGVQDWRIHHDRSLI
jgi:hypothetical protein